MRKLVFILLTIYLVWPFQSIAAAKWCTGKIISSYIGSDGIVYILGNWKNDWTAVCNLNSTWKGVEQATCKG